MKHLIFAGLALSLAGCMSARVVLSDKYDRTRKPVYVDHFDWLGLDGDGSVTLSKVCVDQKPHAVQKVKSAEDIALSMLTLGVYSPVSVKVWCGE
ncbi:MAG TPA: hypothetical protein PKC28_00185 [Bdellovibrionales bacterium]|nr:hypothetical protein [Bdellovibrionales bacterium]